MDTPLLVALLLYCFSTSFLPRAVTVVALIFRGLQVALVNLNVNVVIVLLCVVQC